MADATLQTDDRQGIRSQYALLGSDRNIRHLIYHRDNDGEIIVFVDHELDLEWECDDEAQQWLEGKGWADLVGKTWSAIAPLECVAQNWPPDLKLTAKRLLGEPLARALRGNLEAAQEALKHAEDFVEDKSRQVSRYWILQACAMSGGVAGIFGFIAVWCRAGIGKALGPTAYALGLCFCAGCVGALLFVILRLGKQPKVDSTAERKLHYMEGISRIGAGGIAGVLVGTMVKLGVFLPAFGKLGMELLAMCAAAMIAGASEKLAAGIVTRVENENSAHKEASDAND